MFRSVAAVVAAECCLHFSKNIVATSKCFDELLRLFLRQFEDILDDNWVFLAKSRGGLWQHLPVVIAALSIVESSAFTLKILEGSLCPFVVNHVNQNLERKKGHGMHCVSMHVFLGG